jgi:hypothetical protein
MFAIEIEYGDTLWRPLVRFIVQNLDLVRNQYQVVMRSIDGHGRYKASDMSSR